MEKCEMTKQISFSELPLIRQRHADRKIVFTNGCFDLLHVGHIRCLRFAASLGDILVVGLNSDDSVKRLKGESRPIIHQEDRAEMLAALDFVDYIIIFEEDTPYKLVECLHPNVLVKGGDWKAEQIKESVLADEFVQAPYYPDKSTSNIIDTIRLSK